MQVLAVSSRSSSSSSPLARWHPSVGAEVKLHECVASTDRRLLDEVFQRDQLAAMRGRRQATSSPSRHLYLILFKRCTLRQHDAVAPPPLNDSPLLQYLTASVSDPRLTTRRGTVGGSEGQDEPAASSCSTKTDTLSSTHRYETKTGNIFPQPSPSPHALQAIHLATAPPCTCLPAPPPAPPHALLPVSSESTTRLPLLLPAALPHPPIPPRPPGRPSSTSQRSPRMNVKARLDKDQSPSMTDRYDDDDGDRSIRSPDNAKSCTRENLQASELTEAVWSRLPRYLPNPASPYPPAPLHLTLSSPYPCLDHSTSSSSPSRSP
ncbi:hypothetical protein R3P38DRAFT_3229448 [Favolaschia claudopus]|uniref:Uncharacterized protein n=1 Tax=Favolaschia claudopus TaxID=2862362 RepID=A0AAV9ZPG5_9AGAR